MKDGADILIKPVFALCNLSNPRGVLSNACKDAKLKPIFKKEKKPYPSNYRSISLLPVISKIIEKVVHGQTEAFLSDENIYCTITNYSLEQIIQQVFICPF